VTGAAALRRRARSARDRGVDQPADFTMHTLQSLPTNWPHGSPFEFDQHGCADLEATAGQLGIQLCDQQQTRAIRANRDA